jgi:DNA primase
VISLHQGGVTNVVSSSGTSLTEGQLKLISNLTKNLTILYDGDAAGIKAAMRGLDMALAESFNVKLVLLPDGEDPDSFVQKSGAEAFKTYVEQNKRDVIGFRMEVGLKEAGNDPMKRSQLVNEIAETISKINKTEDFTLQQYYIRESATQLQIDEQGLINLVNKFIRERLQQEQRHNDRKQTQQQEPVDEPSFYFDEETGESIIVDVLQKDYGEEWQLLRILLEYGNKPFKEEGTVAQLFFETIDLELLENPLAKRMVTEYHEYWTNNHQIPDHKYFTSHVDKVIRQKAADLLHVHHVPSQNWQEKHRIEVLHGDQIYEAEIESTFAYFELKLLRRLLNENMKQMQYEKDIQKIMVLMKAHQSLKLREKELMSIVIVR